MQCEMIYTPKPLSREPSKDGCSTRVGSKGSPQSEIRTVQLARARQLLAETDVDRRAEKLLETLRAGDTATETPAAKFPPD